MGSSALHRRFQEYIQYSEIRHLAYNIVALQQEKMFHSLAILSCFPAEGKTLLCAALAMAYSETSQSKVLIVDTTSTQGKGSLPLKECFNGSTPLVELRTLSEIGRRPQLPGRPSKAAPGPVLEPTVVPEGSHPLPPVAQDNNFTKLKQLTEDPTQEYGLVILDTMPLHARNKGNVDPLIVARMAGASVLVVSRKFLNAPKLNSSLRLLKDPSLHLIGIVANEERTV